MNAKQKRNPMIGLGVTTAMAAVILSGCSSTPAPRAQVSAADTQLAIANGQHNEAIQVAELAVAADPRNAASRMALGNAYLDAGRFASASATFEDAMALGDNSARAALSLALSLTGQARYAEAASLLNDWETEIAASDLGLALALSGQPDRGIHVLSNAIRGGENTVKSRQNLAYAYAVAGRWREARMMVAQDVPAHEVGDRMEEWAQMTHAEAYRTRVASLLGVPATTRDLGQPTHLALVNTPNAVQLASEASAQQPAAAPQLASLDAERMSVPVNGGELPSVGSPAPASPAPVSTTAVSPAVGMGAPALAPIAPSTPRNAAPTSFAEAFAAEPGVPGAPSSRYNPAAQAQPVAAPSNVAAPAAPAAVRSAAAAPATRTAAAPAPRRAASTSTPAIAQPALATAPSAPSTGSSHLIQLGSFSSEAGATRAWGIYVSRYPELADREMVITQAVVNGRNYWRVSAGGYDRAGSQAMCGRVDAANGDGCISWAASSPLPGAIDTGVRLARR